VASYRLIASFDRVGPAFKGKAIGGVRPGSAVLTRFLPKPGLVPGRDVAILSTGIAESNKRILGMLLGCPYRMWPLPFVPARDQVKKGSKKAYPLDDQKYLARRNTLRLVRPFSWDK
jgi:hypothetical protein